MDSLYAKYLKERQGIESLWNEHSFVTYRICGPECFIVDMGVESGSRGRGLGRRLVSDLSRIAREADARFLTANIHLKDKGANDTLQAAQACGFEVTGAHNDVLLISKKIKEDSHGR